jgi:hypothetical protein
MQMVDVALYERMKEGMMVIGDMMLGDRIDDKVCHVGKTVT